MNTLQMNYFLAAAEDLNFSKTARRLYVSQPSVSHQISALEKELECTLLDRRNKNAMRLTEAGRIYRDAFLSFRRELMAAADAVERARGSGRRSIKLCLPEEWDAAELTEFCTRRLKEEFPRCDLTVQAADFTTMYQGLAQGRYDVIVCAETSLRNIDTLTTRRIARLRAMAVYSEKNKAAEKNEPTLNDFRGQSLYLLPEEETPMFRGMITGHMLSVGYMPQIKECPNRASIIFGLDRGEGWAVFDEMNRYVRREGYRAFPLESHVQMCAVMKAGAEDPAAQCLAGSIKEWFDM